MENIENLAKEIQENKDSVISILKDTLNDYRKRDLCMMAIIGTLIIALSGCFFFFQWSTNKTNSKHQEELIKMAQDYDTRFKDFLSEYEFESVTVTADSTEGGNAFANNGGDLINGQGTNNNPADEAQR